VSDFELRRRLAQLPRELPMQRDLWPGVLARIAPQAPRRRRARRWMGGFALAASLALAAILALGPEPLGLGTPALPAPRDPLLIQADTLAAEYRGALRELGPIAFPPELVPTVADLDSSVAELHQALASDPSADFLLDRLRNAYAQRLRLSQRVITEWT
jgi:hypothetical protein